MHRWERSTWGRCMAMTHERLAVSSGLHTILTNYRFSGSPNVQNPQPTTSLLVKNTTGESVPWRVWRHTAVTRPFSLAHCTGCVPPDDAAFPVQPSTSYWWLQSRNMCKVKAWDVKHGQNEHQTCSKLPFRKHCCNETIHTYTWIIHENFQISWMHLLSPRKTWKSRAVLLSASRTQLVNLTPWSFTCMRPLHVKFNE